MFRYGAQLATDHHYRSRDDRSDRRDESRRKDLSGGSSNRNAHAPYDSNKSCKSLNQFKLIIAYLFLLHDDTFFLAYGMSRNSESSSWSSTGVKNSYGTVGSSSGTNNMVMSSRPDPWSHNTFRDMESSIWQRPSQQLPEKYVFNLSTIDLGNSHITIVYLVVGGTAHPAILHLCQ